MKPVPLTNPITTFLPKFQGGSGGPSGSAHDDRNARQTLKAFQGVFPPTNCNKLDYVRHSSFLLGFEFDLLGAKLIKWNSILRYCSNFEYIKKRISEGKYQLFTPFSNDKF